MKYYKREFTIKDYQGTFGRKVYAPCTEYVKTNDIERFNKRLKYRFYESAEAKKYLLHKEKDKVYREIEQVLRW